MASASSFLPEEQFLCAICLDVFVDPIATPCGHNYCKGCITHYWDNNDVCHCPLCNRTFYERPDVAVNTFISEMADQFRESKKQQSSFLERFKQKRHNASQPPAEPEDVSCDVCMGNKLKALKSCLVCLTSYCETHLEPHQRLAGLKRHKLINPVKNLLCGKHDSPLELFCTTCKLCVCQICPHSDHNWHPIVSLKEASEGMKPELGKTEAEVQQMILDRQVKIQDIQHAVQLSQKDADTVMAASVQILNSQIRCIQRSKAELTDVIQEKHKTTEKQAEGFLKELQLEITALKTKSSELKQLSQSEDHLHLLQNFVSINTPPPIKDWTKSNVLQSSYVVPVRAFVEKLEKTLSQENENNLGDAELRRIQQYAVDVTLDPDTANISLILSDDGKEVSHGNDFKILPVNPGRFSSSCPCVLGKQSFASGSFYYAVQVKGKTEWDLGVVRESINRRVQITLNPNDGYWILGLRNGKRGNEYKAHAGPAVLPVREDIQKVGVFVDYEEGLVSFYDVEARVNLYSFTGCTFTEKLYPYFSPCPNGVGKSTSLIIS